MNKLICLTALWLSLITGLGLYTISKERQALTQLAFETSRAFFELIVMTRSWNAEHGGVYVPVTGVTQPNPYLKDDGLRDFITKDGRQFTQINPAYMTRQISEIAAVQKGVIFHMTSLNPIRPKNTPKDWEKKALQGFLTGEKEFGEFTDKYSEKGFHYMAPLYLKQACLKCHPGTTSDIGSLRGGISVTLPHFEVSDSLFTLKLFGFLGCIGLIIIISGGLLLIREQSQLINNNIKLNEAFNKIKTLSGLIPICMHCKEIRDDQGFWSKLELFLSQHSNAQFSHSICPKCMAERYPDIDYDEDEDQH